MAFDDETTARLTMAYVWTCSRCGYRQSVPGVAMTVEEAAAVGESDDEVLEMYRRGEVTRAPDRVACDLCTAEFDVDDDESEDDE